MLNHLIISCESKNGTSFTLTYRILNGVWKVWPHKNPGMCGSKQQFFSGIFLILLLFLFNIRVNGENDQNCHPCSSNRYSIVARGEDECKPQ